MWILVHKKQYLHAYGSVQLAVNDVDTLSPILKYATEQLHVTLYAFNIVHKQQQLSLNGYLINKANYVDIPRIVLHHVTPTQNVYKISRLATTDIDLSSEQNRGSIEILGREITPCSYCTETCCTMNRVGHSRVPQKSVLYHILE